ncbi:disulfide isomerase DsbC N-terminal domain-containing protein, partial [Leptospira sp. SA-E8]|uniref:disulfide isomerase DsbC N-terminal domain-containing protein n=1 Tax=Leptospira sp. SA-E8 TaxID=3422259 RepID=UPI003EC122A5
MSLLRNSCLPVFTALLFSLAPLQHANAQQEPAAAAAIRKNLAARLPQMPAISEVRALPVAGLYEVRIGD